MVAAVAASNAPEPSALSVVWSRLDDLRRTGSETARTVHRGVPWRVAPFGRCRR